MLEPFQELADNRDFWNHTLDSLAVLSAKGIFHLFRLQRTMPAFAIVAESFHIKPLIRVLQSADRYQVLGVNRHEIKLYAGNRDALDVIELHPEVPRTLTDALGEELTEPHLTVASTATAAEKLTSEPTPNASSAPLTVPFSSTTHNRQACH